MDSNDPSQQKTEKPKQDPPIGLPAAEGACTLSTGTLVVELEENSHTTDSTTESQSPPEVDRKERGKHVCFNAIEILKPDCPTPETTKTYDNVREYVRQIESLSEMQQCFGECRQTAKKRQHQNQLSDAEGEEEVETFTEELAQKRMRGDSIESADITINETAEQEPIVAVEIEVAVDPPKPDVCVALKHVEQDNQEIAERFKLIMEMFDNFTKNLESLERPTSTMVRDSSKPIRRKRTNSWEVKDISPRVHRSRYDNYMQELTGKTEPSEADTATDPATDSQIQHHTWELDYFRESPCTPFLQPAPPTEQRIEINILRPPQKDMATAMSGFDLNVYSSKDCATIGCQTVATADQSSTVSMPSSCTELQHFTSLERVETLQNYSPMDCRVETYIIDTNVMNNATHTANTITNTAARTNPSVGGVNTTVGTVTNPIGDTRAVGAAGTLDSRDTLTKIPELRSPMMERCPYIAAVTAGPIVEHTFHTIHIEATSSPSSSVMQRPPLCTRLWNVITDFCTAVCLCLQVNRDSLFCLGFCIAFVVSASFLTAFFYRTLSVSPEVYHQQQMLQQQAQQGAVAADHMASASGHDNFYYL